MKFQGSYILVSAPTLSPQYRANTCWSECISWTFLKTTKFSLFQTERVCRQQFEIWWKKQKVLQTCRKHYWKRRNCSLWAISPFHTMFSKDMYYRYVKIKGVLGRCYFLTRQQYFRLVQIQIICKWLFTLKAFLTDSSPFFNLKFLLAIKHLTVEHCYPHVVLLIQLRTFIEKATAINYLHQHAVFSFCLMPHFQDHADKI